MGHLVLDRASRDDLLEAVALGRGVFDHVDIGDPTFEAAMAYLEYVEGLAIALAPAGLTNESKNEQPEGVSAGTVLPEPHAAISPHEVAVIRMSVISLFEHANRLVHPDLEQPGTLVYALADRWRFLVRQQLIRDLSTCPKYIDGVLLKAIESSEAAMSATQAVETVKVLRAWRDLLTPVREQIERAEKALGTPADANPDVTTRRRAWNFAKRAVGFFKSQWQVHGGVFVWGVAGTVVGGLILALLVIWLGLQ